MRQGIENEIRSEKRFFFDKAEVLLMTTILLAVSIVIFGLGVFVGKGIWEPHAYFGAGSEEPTPDAPAVAIDGIEELPVVGAVELEQKEVAGSEQLPLEGEMKRDPTDVVEVEGPVVKRVEQVAKNGFSKREIPQEEGKATQKGGDPKLEGVNDSKEPQKKEERGEEPETQDVAYQKSSTARIQVSGESVGRGDDTALTRKPKAGKYSIQVRAYKKLNDANFALHDLVRQVPNEEIFVVHQEVPSKGLWYRVLIGEFDSAQQAKEYALTLKEKSGIGDFMIRKLQ